MTGFGAIQFQWLWAFALLPLPLLVRWLVPAAKRGRAGALRVPFFAEISRDSGAAGGLRRRNWLKLLTMSLIWLLLVTAAARPAYVGKPVPIPVSGRDLMMAIDLSGSMGRQDFSFNDQATNRLVVVKAVADDFISRRKGDRVGLILFSSRAYVQTPLTFDRTVVRELLDEAEIGLTGQETAIGDAIGLAVKTLKDRPVDERVLVLLTDGANNSGALQPLQAAKLAAQEHVKIYTIGVGADQMAVDTAFGRQIVNPAEDLDEATLSKIAEMTGGRYFRARDIEGLAKIYQEIDAMEPVSGEPLYLHPSVTLFQWPLGAALVLSFGLGALMLVPNTFGGRIPVPAPAAPAAPAVEGGEVPRPRKEGFAA